MPSAPKSLSDIPKAIAVYGDVVCIALKKEKQLAASSNTVNSLGSQRGPKTTKTFWEHAPAQGVLFISRKNPEKFSHLQNIEQYLLEDAFTNIQGHTHCRSGGVLA